ncbi:peroxisomal coenzyme A diphosphatase NUDT7 isoform X1 [Bufo gargarizans]|uniref:peroxisomal coenzyme A diphosphatase NUDT7 isoform X1 n=1 Tax=Bufo gargarizans TaxID=30331 RepID=UPI001CF132EC|nr:peroxisomal coenzyme A diphosphatase NUDT7 isoform X1 [Bufo gargarizans]
MCAFRVEDRILQMKMIYRRLFEKPKKRSASAPNRCKLLAGYHLISPSLPSCLVYPIVGIVDDTFQPTPNPSEVADIFLVPLEFFISSEHYTAREVNVPPFGLVVVHQFIYMDPDTEKSFTIWGLTAHFALMLAIILLEKRPSFDPEFDLEGGLNGWKRFLINPSKL